MLLSMEVCGYANLQTNSSYLYNQEGKDVVIPDVYNYRESIALRDSSGNMADEPLDMAFAADGTIAVADTGNNRILILEAGKETVALTAFRSPEGEEIPLSGPEGVCLCDDGTLLVADTQNNRVVSGDREGNLLRVYGRPANMLGVEDEEPYLPVKVARDTYGRLYIVARNINRGIICMDADGLFVGYVGAPRVVPDIFELLWRRISTKAQKEQMTQYASTEYNNVLVDGQNFIWGTISALDADDIKAAVRGRDTSGQVTPVVKINSNDTDVLKRNGKFAPLGDLRFEEEPSRIVDVATGPGGTYSLLDHQRGRIFTYDDNGELLYVFGGLGNEVGELRAPAAFQYVGSDIYVLDRTASAIVVYAPTEYGQLVLDAVSAQYSGDFDRSYQLWAEVARYNSNFEYAFIGMGNICTRNQDYEKALEYFRYADSPEKYSETFELMRKQNMAHWFPYIFYGIIALILLWVIGKPIRRAVRYIRGREPS